MAYCVLEVSVDASVGDGEVKQQSLGLVSAVDAEGWRHLLSDVDV